MSKSKAPQYRPGQANAYAAIVSSVSMGTKRESVVGRTFCYHDDETDAIAYATEYAEREYGRTIGLKFERVELVSL